MLLCLTPLRRPWHHRLDTRRSLLVFIQLRHMEPPSLQGVVGVVLQKLDKSSTRACNYAKNEKQKDHQRTEARKKKYLPTTLNLPKHPPHLASMQHRINIPLTSFRSFASSTTVDPVSSA